MTPFSSLGTWVAVWAIVVAAIFAIRSGQRVVGVGLVSAFLVGFALRYWFPAALYLLPWSEYTFDPDTVAAGFQVSTLGVLSFAVGSLVLAPMLQVGSRGTQVSVEGKAPALRIAKTYMAIGVICFVVLLPILRRVPTVTSIVIQGWGLMVVGLALACWSTWRSSSSRSFTLWVFIALTLPFLTIVTQGFLGYGTLAATAVLAMVAGFYRPRWKALLLGIVLAYLGLSVYVTYMRDRTAIRETEGVASRVQSVASSLKTLELFDLGNADHLSRIDVRLNQNYLVGSAVAYLDSGLGQFAYGRTIVDGVLSLVPRIIWPSKPQVAGSGTLVSQYTGLEFASGTAVGIGLAMESFVSFGRAGVCVAFAVLGTALTVIDRNAGRRLRHGDWFGFAAWFLPGLALLQTESSIVEVTSSVGAAIVVVVLSRRFVARLHRAPERQPMARERYASRPVHTRT